MLRKTSAGELPNARHDRASMRPQRNAAENGRDRRAGLCSGASFNEAAA